MKSRLSLISLALSLILVSSPHPRVEQRHRLCQLVDSHITMDFSEGGRFDNGYSEDRYHYVLDSVLELFSPLIEERGGRLRIKRDWTDGAVNAWAERWGDLYILEIPGGMARYHLINEEGFLTTICHELGHLLGGAPHRRTISVEGQADYYSTMKCMEPLLSFLGYELEEWSDSHWCSGDFCQARLRGALSLTSYYAELERRPPPSPATPDPTVVQRTIVTHPNSQCRLDTMLAGIRCSNRKDFSYNDQHTGACQGPLEKRPSCWYRSH